jgi:hypothetical protein
LVVVAVPAVTVKVAELAPAGTITLPGAEAALAEVEASDTTAPPEGAAVDRVTVAVSVPPLATELDDKVRL